MGQGKSREIRTKIKSIRNTEKVTRAMKLVSASKLRRAQTEIEKFRSYMLGVEEVLLQVIDPSCQHGFLSTNRSKTACIVLFSGERSLCGAYNTNALKDALGLEEELIAEGYTVEFMSIGKKGAQGLRYRGRKVVHEFSLKGAVPEKSFSAEIAAWMADRFKRAEYGRIDLVYTEFKSAMTKFNRRFQLLPLDLEESVRKDFLRESGDFSKLTGKSVYYYFEPSQEAIVHELLLTYLRGKVHGAFVESLASEYGSRMLAMENATKNANELIASLTLKLNRARQAAITQEIAEIVGGAASLEG